MKITKVSQLTGKRNTLDINVTYQELERHRNGEFAQHVWPNLTSDEREFLISGITPTEWNQTFG